MRKFLVVLVFLFALTGYAHAQSGKEVHELQERCNKSADDRFKSEYGDGVFRYDAKLHAMTKYTTHYNRKWNRCFVLLSVLFLTDKKEKRNVLKRLVDMNGNMDVGTFQSLSPLDDIKKCVLSLERNVIRKPNGICL